jgi:lipoprotein-releasing system ATP-binding protein
MALLSAHDIWKAYGDTAVPVEVLRGLDFELVEGQSVGVYGASGAGKSTFLHLLGGLDRPTAGTICAAGVDLRSLTEEELARFRNREVGFVFQFYHLLPEFTALENVMLPALIGGLARREAAVRAEEALVGMGLSERLSHRPAMLSGGEQQRVAIARAAVMRPRVILADEPTGNLDRETGMKVWQYLLSLHREHAVALVVVTHNRDLLGDFAVAYELRDGRLCVWPASH